MFIIVFDSRFVSRGNPTEESDCFLLREIVNSEHTAKLQDDRDDQRQSCRVHTHTHKHTVLSDKLPGFLWDGSSWSQRLGCFFGLFWRVLHCVPEQPLGRLSCGKRARVRRERTRTTGISNTARSLLRSGCSLTLLWLIFSWLSWFSSLRSVLPFFVLVVVFGATHRKQAHRNTRLQKSKRILLLQWR